MWIPRPLVKEVWAHLALVPWFNLLVVVLFLSAAYYNTNRITTDYLRGILVHAANTEHVQYAV